MLASFLFATTLLPLFAQFSKSILGVMLLCSAVELVSSIRGLDGEEDFTIAIITGGVGIALNNLAVGFCAGVVASLIFLLYKTECFGIFRRRAEQPAMKECDFEA